MIDNRIVGVTVTYGSRWSLVKQTIDAALTSGVTRLIIVDNNASVSISSLVVDEFSSEVNRITVVHHSSNLGSAGGFASGIAAAMEFKPDFIMLLDDDNVLNAGALDILTGELLSLQSQAPSLPSAVLGFRSSHFGTTKGDDSRFRHNADCFFGFHILDVHKKVSTRLFPAVPKIKSFGQLHQIDVAPYGGLLLSRETVELIGLPNIEMVLYADDYEYTYRITKGGGNIFLVMDAEVRDVDLSWNLAESQQSAIASWIFSGSDFRIFYTSRNHSYFEKHVRKHNKYVRLINKYTYISFLLFFAIWNRRLMRFKLILKGINAGERKYLGISKSFPLP